MDWIFPDYLLGRARKGVRIAQSTKGLGCHKDKLLPAKMAPTVYFTTLPPLLLWIQLHLEELLFLTYPSSLTGVASKGCGLCTLGRAACLQEAYSAGTFWDAPPLSHLLYVWLLCTSFYATLHLRCLRVVLTGISEFVDCFYFLFSENVNCGRDLR